MLIIGNLDADGYLKEPLADLADEAERRRGAGRDGAASASRSSIRSACGARALQECLLIQARHIGADDDVRGRRSSRSTCNLEKKNYQAIAKDLKQPVEEIYEAAKVITKFDPKPGRQYTDRRAARTSRPTSTSTRSATSTSWSPTTTACPS